MIDFIKPTVEVHLQRGINMCDGQSASGKSYLVSLLKDYSDAPGLKYYSSIVDYDNILKEGIDVTLDNTIYFFDRADLLMNDEVRKLIIDSSDAYIIVDTKKFIFRRVLCNSHVIWFKRDKTGRLLVE